MSMTISMDDNLKEEFTDICREIGLPPSTAIGIFVRTVVRERCIPFTLSAGNGQATSGHADGLQRKSVPKSKVLQDLVDVSSRDMLLREDSKALRSMWARA